MGDTSQVPARCRTQVTKFLLKKAPGVAVLAILLSAGQSALAYYYPSSHVPPGPPPNYNQVDTTYFLGTPNIPLPPPDSGGYYIYYDQGKWTVAHHIFSKGGSLEQFHGSILAVMEQPPQMGVNVFVTDFEFWHDTTSNRCLDQNDRWGWVQWSDSLYEIWWDVTTKEYKPSKNQVDANDFLEFCIVGCAIDFNVWSSGHGGPFDESQVYLGSAKTPLSTVPGFTDTFVGISDPYQSQAGSDPEKDPNITIFTSKALSGDSYNKDGLITSSDSYVCDATYGSRYAGAFAYEGNGIQFSTNCEEPENQLPNIFPDFESNVFVCGLDSTCYVIIGSDPDVDDTVTLSLLQGPVAFTPQTAPTIVTDTICFFPDTSGTYRFIWQVQDRFGLVTIDTVDINVTVNSGPVSSCPNDTTVFQCAPEEICVGPFLCTDVDGNLDSCGSSFGTFVGHTCFGGVNVRPDATVTVSELASLQTFFDGEGQTIDVIADQSSAALFQTGDSATSSFELHLEMAGFASQNKFGVYSCGAPDTLYEVFSGSNVVGHTAVASFNDGGVFGKLVVRRYDASSTLLDSSVYTNVNASSFGFYLQSPDQGGSTFYSEDVLNADSVTECLAYAGTGTRANGFWLAWEDLDRSIPGHADDDFNDMLLFVDVVKIADGCRGFVCFTPDTAGVYEIVWTCQDACGAATSCTTFVTVNLNSAPVASCPGDQSLFVCDLSPISVAGFSVSDADGNISSVSVNGGTLSGDTVTFTPVIGSNVITLIGTDSCGAADTCVTTVTVAMNSAPVAACPGDQSLFVCDLSSISLAGFACSDPDGNLASTTVSGGTISGDTVTFTPVVGPNTLTVVCVDSCGLADTCVTTVTITLNSAPVATCPGDQPLFVCDLSPISIAGFSVADADANLSSVSVNGGTLSGDTVTFTPVAGANVISLIGVDSCGAADTCVTTVTVSLNSAPVATCPGDESLFVCDLSPISIAGFACADADGNIASNSISGGALSGDTVTFTPVEGANVITQICVDSCGAADTCTTTITVTLNSAPVAACPAPDTFFVCDLSPISVAGFACSDPDGNLASAAVTGGTLSGDTVTFTPVMGANTITTICTDSCGASDTCSVTFYVDENLAPVATCPSDQSLFVCDLSDICIAGFSAVDGDGNLSTVTVDNGTLSGDTVCFTPVAGANVITIIATDACGAADTCVTTVTVNVNSAPVATCPGDQSLFVCDLSPISLSGFSCTDADGNLASSTANSGTLSGDTVTFTPVAGVNQIILTCIDSCGAQSSCTTNVTVTLNSAPTVSCPSDASFTLCGPEQICVGPFSSSDADANFSSETFSFGTQSASDICFTPDTAGVYSIVYTVTDSCGASASCTTLVTVDFFPTPALADATHNFALCDTATVCVPVPAATGGGGALTYTVDGLAAGDSICVSLTGSGQHSFEVIVTDSCGAADTATVTVNATVNGAPQITGIDTSPQFVCAIGDTICLAFSVVDPDNGLSGISQLGIVNMSDSTVCFVATSTGQFCDQLIISDSCGLADTIDYCVDVLVNSAPACSTPANQTIFVCDLSEICVSGFSCADPDGNLVSSTVSVGTLANGEVCFTPVAGPNDIILTCTDACGAQSSCTTTVDVVVNSAPTVTCAADSVVTVCGAGEQICLTGFGATDTDGNLAGASASFGTLAGSQVCFTVDTAGVYEVIYTATDSCGASAACTTLVAVDFFGAPSLPQDATVNGGFLCTAGQVCFDRPTATGGNGPYTYSVSGNCQLVGNQICLTVGTGSVNVACTLTVTDACGATDTQVLTYVADVNSPPTASCPGDQVIEVCDVNSIVCIPGFDCTDPDGNLATTTSNIGSIAQGSLCFTPGAAGDFNITVTCTDECGAQTTCNLTVTIVEGSPVTCAACPTITLEKAHNVLQGEQVCLSITSQGNIVSLGGFDFLLAYDQSALSAISADPGTFILGCGWEYFTYRFGANGNCAGACPSGLIRIVGLAETNNGMGSPICYGPSTSDPVELARICFQVSNDRTLECQFAPVRFYWMDCGDNALADQTGDSLYLSGEVYDFGGTVSIADPTVGFPTYQGTQAGCLVGGGPGKPAPENCLTFQNGGVDIICADSIDARGDVNLNGQANEIADAVMFNSFFIEGLAAFSDHIDGSIAATEVNGDGLPLSVADLVYLIRVIVGDALPLPKLNHNLLTLTIGVRENVYSVNMPLGGALFVFDGDANVELLQEQMEMSVGVRDGKTYALVIPAYGPGKTASTIFNGDLIRSDGELLDVSASDVDGATVQVKTSAVLPDEFALYQNFPNPFNPETKVAFDLPEMSAYTLTIYNLVGQVVAEFRGVDQGRVEVSWEASDNASGVYLYKLTAGKHSATRKMMLLK